MTPEIITAWGGVAAVVIAAIAAVARYGANKGDEQKNAPGSYLVINDKRAQDLSENMGMLVAVLSRTTKALDAVIEGQEFNQRALGRNSDAAERVHDTATELRIAIKSLEATIEHTLRPHPPR